MNFVSQLIRHIGSCIRAEKGKRIFYAVVNHTVVNFIFIFNREERGYAICAFIIALLSIIAMVVVMVILLK